MSAELYLNQAGIQTLTAAYNRMRQDFLEKAGQEKVRINNDLPSSLKGQASLAYLQMFEDFVLDFNRFIDSEIQQLQMTLTQTADKITQVDAELGAIIGRMRG